MAVMYLLDGAGHFHHTTGVVAFLKKQGLIPDMIVVGIPNTDDRTRDLTPAIETDSSASVGFPTAGGADKMLAFIKEELIPQINAEYNTNAYKVLVGHSFGGLFSVNALIKEPTLFDAHISISPSMWWDNQQMVARAEAFLDTIGELDVFYYMTMGNEGGSMLGGAMKLAALFEEKKPHHFNFEFKPMPEETHGSIPHRSTYDGLEAIFKQWFLADFESLYAAGGMEAIKEHYRNISSKFGFDMSPSESDVNIFGYSYMRRGGYAKALEIFLENIKLYPKSFNVYDSAAEAYMELGEKDKAIEFYEKSLEINPANENGMQMLKKLGVEYDPMQNSISLTVDELKKFVGLYQDENVGEIKIELENDFLTLTLAALPDKQTMYPFPNHSFLMKPQNTFLSFLIDRKYNAVFGFTAQIGPGMQLEAKRKM
jgi:predicted alpha/beta superfamily hydrolase